jgi:hypothetical protein
LLWFHQQPLEASVNLIGRFFGCSFVRAIYVALSSIYSGKRPVAGSRFNHYCDDARADQNHLPIRAERLNGAYKRAVTEMADLNRIASLTVPAR